MQKFKKTPYALLQSLPRFVSYLKLRDVDASLVVVAEEVVDFDYQL